MNYNNPRDVLEDCDLSIKSYSTRVEILLNASLIENGYPRVKYFKTHYDSNDDRLYFNFELDDDFVDEVELDVICEENGFVYIGEYDGVFEVRIDSESDE